MTKKKLASFSTGKYLLVGKYLFTKRTAYGHKRHRDSAPSMLILEHPDTHDLIRDSPIPFTTT